MLNKAKDLDSTYSSIYQELGNRHHRQAVYKFGGNEEFQLAEHYLLRALELAPDNVRALFNLALLYTEQDKK
jgi:tetratricopeptide (TPR) repeat protein